MKKSFLSCLLLIQLLLLPFPVAAQSTRTQDGALPELASVTFTFNSLCEDCATQSGEAGENRYFVDVPILNNPSPAKSGSADDLSMEVKVKQDRIVYAILFKPGTAPRAVWRDGGRVLQVFFVPPGAAGRNKTASLTSAPLAAMSDETASGTPVALKANAEPVSASAASTSTLAPVIPAPTVSAAPQMTAAPSLQPLTQPINRDEPGSSDFMNVDLSVPESPAFTVLGLTPQTVIRPTSPRQFASSLLSGVDMNGNFQSGLALDFVPYLVFAGDELTLRAYQDQYFTRLLSRTQVSFATTKGASDDDKSMRLALGFHATLWDRGDPRTDKNLFNCLGQMRLPAPPTQLEPELLVSLPVRTSGETDEAFAARLRSYDEELRMFTERSKLYTMEQARYERDKQAAIEFNNGVSARCREQAQKDNWNRSSWIIAAAPSWISLTGETKNYKWNGGGFWTSLAYGFEGVPGMKDRSQLILHARYRNREQVPDPDAEGEFITNDSVFFGARFRHGSPTFNGSFEYTFIRARPLGESWDNLQRLALGFERRIAGDIWFNLSLGGETGRLDGKNNGFVLTSFKWAFSDRKNVPTPQIQ
jgi:hypothetical protein